MESQIHCLNPRLVCRISPRKPTYLCSFLLSPRPRVHKITSVSSYNHGQRISATTATTQTPISKPENIYAVNFQTLSSCKLGISRYPDFEYNAEGGRGTGPATRKSIDKDSNGEISVEFDLKTLYIPPLTSSTTKFLGLPLPPFLRIDITPEMFHGSIIPETGQVDLEFQAKFVFSVGTVYRAPPLMVKTVLTSEESRGTIRRGRGKKLDEEGKCKLVGVAMVQPIDDIFMDTFLGLPTECLADLSAIISVSDNQENV